MPRTLLILSRLSLCVAFSVICRGEEPPHVPAAAPVQPELGVYFKGTGDKVTPLPTVQEMLQDVPEPVLDAHPDWVRMYERCWEIAQSNLITPPAKSLLVSSYLDSAFAKVTGCVYQWDSCFMMMFARYGTFPVPLIHSLDNFYATQHRSGYICREINGKTGRAVMYGRHGGYRDPEGWKNTINPPLFAWAECETYRITGDKSRFALVRPILEKYVEFLNRDGDPEADPATYEEQGRRSVGTPHQLYWNTDLGSGMDDTPKPTRKGAGWVDLSCQMVMQYRELAFMCRELGDEAQAARDDREAQAIADRINHWCWNEQDGFYYDVQTDGTQFKSKTACGFWPLLAGIASPHQVECLVAHLKNEQEFWRPFIFPTLAADEKDYRNPAGHYWRGAVWAPTNYMIIKGLENCGQETLARAATEKYLQAMAEVFVKSNTVYENYMPEKIEPESKRGNFVGWTGLGPIALLIENVLGFRADGVHNSLTWHLTQPGRHGIRRLHFGHTTADLIYDGQGTVAIKTNASFTLLLNGQSHLINAGESRLAVSAAQ